MTWFGREYFPLEATPYPINGAAVEGLWITQYNNTIPQGWQCPVCKKVHAPWIASCDCDVNKPISNATLSVSGKYVPVPITDMPNVGSMTIGAKDE